MLEELISVFEKANKTLITKDNELFITKVSERTLCGALMLHLHEEIKETKYKDYNVDVEYNRNLGGKLKTIIKTISGPGEKVIRINCDLIVHSRGHKVNQDNLIAVEMKKSERPNTEKESDKERLIALTKKSFNDVWSYDGKTFPEHVCGYELGIYYEIDYKVNEIILEYYVAGNLYSKKVLNFNLASKSVIY